MTDDNIVCEELVWFASDLLTELLIWTYSGSMLNGLVSRVSEMHAVTSHTLYSVVQKTGPQLYCPIISTNIGQYQQFLVDGIY